MDIKQLRLEIDDVDEQLVSLFRRRMEISTRIAEYKKKHDLAVLDPAREREKLSDVASKVEPELQNDVQVLYSLLFELSRSYQCEKNAVRTALFAQISDAIENTPRLFPQSAAVACCASEEDLHLSYALQRLFKTPNALYFRQADAVISAVQQGLCRYGLLPLENQRLFEKLADAQLFVLRSVRIGGSDGRFSRFLLFGKALEIYPGADKTTLLMRLPNRPGSLYRVLARLYTLGLNIADLDASPAEADGFQMRFRFDLESSVYSHEFVRLMCELDDLCEGFCYLGSYSEVF